MPTLSQRVVITGIGLVTPLGADRESSWLGLKQGRSATRWLGDRHDFPETIAGLKCANPVGMLAGAPAVASLNGDDAVAPLGGPVITGGSRDQGRVDLPHGKSTALFRADRDPVVSLAIRAAREAVADAELDIDRIDRDRVGCVVGTSKGGLRSFSSALRRFRSSDTRDSHSDWWSQFVPSASVATVAEVFGLNGPALCPVAACATGLASLLRGAELIRDGYCDAVLAGSSDASLQQTLLASFQRLRVLASDFDDPATACRPFDRRRNGFLVGEGAAILVMERYEHAAARGATPCAEWIAGRSAADPSGLLQLEANATGLTRLIRDVLRDAELTSDEVDYVNLHGTATLANDACETRAVKSALGPAARQVACSSIKGGIGHLLGASGSVEMAATLLAMRDSVVPPTVNLQHQDADCDLDYTAGVARPKRIEHALKLSLGFGGHLVAGVVRAL